ncbi:MAG TPA: nuclear transport factor 2 family protein [Steroidobacteraceae bacterium]|nr:nuclear transport factor 2 family protein [Steroidobacteraceae bacterium]
MKVPRILPAAVLITLVAATPWRSTTAQVAPTENPDQLSMLKDSNPRLARNKKFVFDFWRIVYEARHLDQAPRYMDEGYIQHNPNVPSGRAAFVELFTRRGPPLPIEPRMKMHIINIVADGNIVMVSSVRRMRDTKDPSHIYATTWFDMFRINDKGMIAEHWDPSPLWIDGKPPGAEFLP